MILFHPIAIICPLQLCQGSRGFAYTSLILYLGYVYNYLFLLTSKYQHYLS